MLTQTHLRLLGEIDSTVFFIMHVYKILFAAVSSAIL